MAILRDAVTGEGIFEGSALDAVRIADELGRDNVLFDDVGENFDPDRVLKDHEQHISDLHSALDDAEVDERAKENVKDQIDDKKIPPSLLEEVKKRLSEAHSRKNS